MLKLTIATILALVSTQAFKLNNDFLQGTMTGIWITDDDEFGDYQCPDPEVTPYILNGINFYNLGKSYLYHDDASQPRFLNVVDDYLDSFAFMASLTTPEYDGGDFCAGLTLAFEGRILA